MKLELFENLSVILKPENEQDRAWILSFARNRGNSRNRKGGKNGLDWELNMDKKDINGDGLSGYCEVSEFDDGGLDWEDLESLQIHSFEL
jgi:hypothetical protein